MEEDKQIAETEAEALKIVHKIQAELAYYADRDRCPTVGSAQLFLDECAKLKKLSLKLAWLTAPAFMKEL